MIFNQKSVFFGVRALILALLLVLPGAVLQAQNPQDGRGKLSLEQIKGLLANGLPDTALAGEIRDRGITFSDTLNQLVLDDLQGKGAGPKTLRALEAYLPKSSIKVQTRLERTIVLVDDKQYGTTSFDGTLQVNNLEPGEHVVEVRNPPRYRNTKMRVVLKPNENQEVLLTPELAIGFLTIQVLTANAEVLVRGDMASLSGTFSGREIAPGTYTIEASAKGYQTLKQTIEIRAGQQVSLPIRLEVDREGLSTILLQAQKAFSSKNYKEATQLALQVTTLLPTDPGALTILTQSAFRLNETGNFLEYGKAALESGAALDFSFVLRTEKPATATPVTFRLTSTSVSLLGESGQSLQTVPLESLASISLRGEIQDEVFLNLTQTRAEGNKRPLEFLLAILHGFSGRNTGQNEELQLSQRDTLNALWNLQGLLQQTADTRKEFLRIAGPDALPSTPDSPPKSTETAKTEPERPKPVKVGKEKEKPVKTEDPPKTVEPTEKTPEVSATNVPKSPKVDVRTTPDSNRAAKILINLALRNAGTAEKFELIKDVRFNGSQTSARFQSEKAEVNYVWVRPNRLREDTRMGNLRGTFVYGGEVAWETVEGQGNEPPTQETIRQRRIQAKLFGPGLLQHLKANEAFAERYTRSRQDGTALEVIKVTDVDGDTYEVFFNVKTLLPEKCIYEIPTQLGQPLVIEDRFEDFRMVGGILLPFRVSRVIGGQTVKVDEFSEVRINERPNIGVFKKP
jgi:hypothetical protein